MGSVQIEQKSYEMPPKRESASHIFSPSPTSSDRGSLLRKGFRRSHSELLTATRLDTFSLRISGLF